VIFQYRSSIHPFAEAELLLSFIVYSISSVWFQFFENVFLRMFEMQNPQYDYDASYLRCVSSRMDLLKPFGKTPETLTRNIRQAFVAARTFVQGLAVGRNVAIRVGGVRFPCLFAI